MFCSVYIVASTFIVGVGDAQLPSVTSKGEVAGTGHTVGTPRPVSASAGLASPITTNRPVEHVSVRQSIE